MAGCKPEYFPIVVAATRAVTEYDFHFNHLASLASPWPLLVVNGPLVKKLGMNGGMYLFGPGNRPNSTVGRALSGESLNRNTEEWGDDPHELVGLLDRRGVGTV